MNKFFIQLTLDFAKYRFREGKKFAFRPPHTIIYDQFDKKEYQKMPPAEQKNYELQYKMQLLHEIGHAELSHRDFRTHVERLKMERAAWKKAREIGIRYGVEMDDEFIEDKLDTYREWTYLKTRCPHCGQTRLEQKNGQFLCPMCDLL